MDNREKLAAVAALGCVDAEDVNEHLALMIQSNLERDNSGFIVEGPEDFDESELEYLYAELRHELEN